MQSSIYPSEMVKVAGVIAPATVNSTPSVSGAVDMRKFRRVTAILSIGNVAAETVDFRLEADTVNTFNDSVATVVAATQLAAHASNNDNTHIILECKAEDLAEGDIFLRARAVTGDTSGGPMSCVILGLPHYSNEAQLAAVVEVARA